MIQSNCELGFDIIIGNFLGKILPHELLVSQRLTLKSLTHFRRGYFEAKFTEYSFNLMLATLNIVSAIIPRSLDLFC